jgi:hypothetical protein
VDQGHHRVGLWKISNEAEGFSPEKNTFIEKKRKDTKKLWVI